MPTRLDRLVYRSVATMPMAALLPLAELLGEAQRNGLFRKSGHARAAR